jgi:hypothetical protein
MRPIREFRTFVDRIEGNRAVLLLGEDERQSIAIPAEYLPDGAGEGSVLTVSLHYEAEQTEQATEEAAALIRKLTKRET